MRGETVLCIAPRVWRSLWRDTQAVMSRLAEENLVLYLEPGRNPDQSHSSEMWRNMRGFLGLCTETIAENLILVQTPSCLPIMRQHLPAEVLNKTTPWVARINAAILELQISRAMAAFHVQAPILWLYSPYDTHLVNKFGAKLTCYYNYDEHPDFVQNRRISGLLRQYDDQLCRMVDVVFATSRPQWERRRVHNPHTYLMPNGVDFDIFHRALEPNGDTPADLRDIAGPVIGYAGWLGYQIDVPLLLQVAQRYPTCSLVLVGPDELPPSPAREQLRRQPNVHLLGRKEREEMPAYLRAFDVALVPYALDGHVLSIYPLKLHEYLAAGRAVVSVALPELRRYSDVVRIAETKEQFVADIACALHDHAPAAIERRVAVARQNTWDARVADIQHILDTHLGESK